MLTASLKMTHRASSSHCVKEENEMKALFEFVMFIGVILNAGMALFNVANQSPNDLVIINMLSMMCFGMALLFSQREK
jgi:hypothetical protein